MRLFLTTTIVLCITIPVWGQPVNTRVPQSPDAPVYIFAVHAEAKEASTRRPERIEFAITYRNIQTTDIQAIRFGILSVGPFGSVIANSTWTEVATIEPYNEAEENSQLELYIPTTMAHAHYFGLAYVDRVLMDDEREWRANPDTVKANIEKKIGRADFAFPDDTTSVVRGTKI